MRGGVTFAALTRNRHSMHSSRQRGKVFGVFGHFPCHVDAKSPFYAFWLSTWQIKVIFNSFLLICININESANYKGITNQKCLKAESMTKFNNLL